jgi:hypothetical protein
VVLPIQEFENLDALVKNTSENIDAKFPIYFFGIDPELPETAEFVKAFMSAEASRGKPFQAVIVDDAIAKIVKIEKSELVQEGFHFHRNLERFTSGIKTADQKKIKLLVVVLNADAIRSKEDSLISLMTKELSDINSLIVAYLPRIREEEKNFSLPCNTGEEDRDKVASLGCYIIQKSRSLYAKNASSALWMGELDLLTSGENLILIWKKK